MNLKHRSAGAAMTAVELRAAELCAAVSVPLTHALLQYEQCEQGYRPGFVHSSLPVLFGALRPLHSPPTAA
jgi:hypothetical protein